MGQRIFAEEAERCRRWADELADLPEAPLLRRIAHAFDALAAERGIGAGWMPLGRFGEDGGEARAPH